MKIVINCSYGGFGLSDAAVRRYAELKGIPIYEEVRFSRTVFHTLPAEDRRVLDQDVIDRLSPKERDAYYDRLNSEISDDTLDRKDPVLVRVVEELGETANGDFAQLAVVDIPAGTHYRIDNYDGMEGIELRDEIHWEIAGD